jgi:hypothetical protein
MDIVTGTVLVTGITALASVLKNTSGGKIQSCVDTYVFTDERGSYEFVQCMKGHHPHKFADAYKRKLQSDAKLTEVSQ